MPAAHLLWTILVGGFTGFLGGIFGKGGSAVATPLLAAGGISSFAALASPLPATIPATVIAASAYWRAKEIDFSVLRTTIALGLPATVVGALLSAAVGGGALVWVCDVVVACLGVRMLTRTRRRTPVLVGAPGRAAEPSGPTPGAVAVVAVITGLASGLLANSGGFLLAPLFATALGLPLRKALGTSLAAAAVLAIPGTIVHAALGHIAWSVTVPFGLASVPLSAFGASIALRTDAHRLEVLYGAVLVILGGALLLVR